MDILCKFCHSLHWLDEKVTQLPAANPQFGSCCLQGKMQIEYMRALPDTLHLLFFSNDKVLKDFRAIIRHYNKAFAFTSSGGPWHLDSSILDGCSPPTFKIRGNFIIR